jgi:glucose/arabinose dehydrogenase
VYRTRTAVLVLALALVAGCGGAASEQAGPEAPRTQERLHLRLVRVAAGFDSPVHVAAPASEPDRLYVVEQPGRIRVVVRGKVRREPFLDIRRLVLSGGEQGLFSVAFHPDYARNRRFYVDYTDRRGDTRVVEYRSNGVRAIPSSARQLLFVDQPYSNHNGGQVAFGPDGRLYVGMGDGGAGGDPENRAQNLATHLGKLLRINVNAPNPEPEIVGYGLRNPWRFSFDRTTGDLYIGDVGQNRFEEVDFTRRNSAGLENYGWDVYEGRARFENKRPNPAGRVVFPIAVYGLGNRCSVAGGFVYRGRRLPSLRGRYFYGDYCSGEIWSLRVRNGRATGQRRERFRVASVSSFGEDARGELYLVSHGGRVYRLAS